MSKNDWIFVIMKFRLFLIILGYTQFIYCSYHKNISEEDYPVCPVSLFRRKRALEYTRWRANQETTQEFIVKILDDYVTTPDTKKVVAVNIQSLNKGTEKIIVGGVMVPPHTTVSPTLELPREYTRFVPPTTVPVTRIESELYLAPASTKTNHSLKPQLTNKGTVNEPPLPKLHFAPFRHPQRDESPPASPQFLTRMPVARQYAPVAPVAFTRRSTSAPLTRSSTEYCTIYETNTRPTRTSSLSGAVIPLRTTHVEHDSIEDLNEMFPSRTNYEPEILLTHTTVTETVRFQSEGDIVHTTNINNYARNMKDENISEQHVFDKSDSAYNRLYIENSDKMKLKEGKRILESENNENKNEFFEKDSESREKPVIYALSKSENKTEREQYVEEIEEDEVDNTTSRLDSKVNLKESQEVTAASETKTVKLIKEKIRNKRRPFCSLLKLRQLNFNSARTLPEIVAQLKQWAEESPVVKWVDITDGNLTTMENPIHMIIVDDPSSGQIMSAKQTVMIVAGIQGRDHYAVSAAMYVLYQLIERSEAHADLLTKYRFWIIPVFNPDGYDYSMTFPHRREWSKNLRQYWDTCKGRESCKACPTYGLRCTVQPCYGVNLDRNFEYQWIPAEELRLDHACGELYAGTRQLSEPETKAVTHFLHEQRTPLFTFIAFKEGDVLGVMYPYSHTKKKRAFDHTYRQRASRAASAAYSISGRPYVAGQTSEFLPLYAGGIEDWVDGHLGIDNTYTIMMFRPRDSYNSKLMTEHVVHEAYVAMDTLLLQSIEPLSPPVAQTALSKGGQIKISQFVVLLVVLILFFNR